MSAYSYILENVFLPCHNLVRNRHYVGYRRFLEKSQWWSPEQLREFQWQEMTALLRHTLASVPYYQEKYRKAGIQKAEDIRTPEDWRRLPVLTRDEVNTYRKELCAQ